MKMEDTKNSRKVTTEKEVIKTEPQNNYYDIKDLPSKYKLYPEGTTIKGRPLKVIDVKLLSSMNNENFNSIMNEVVKRCVAGIDINEILISDKLYIILWLRANTYKDSGYTIEFNCNKCNKLSTYDFSLDTLDVIYIKDDYDENKEITLPVSKDKIKIRYERIRDEFSTEDFINKYQTQIIKFDKDVLDIANLIFDINGKKDISLKSKYDKLIDLNPADYSYIESYIKYAGIGISPVLNVKCNKCGGATLTGVTFSGDFFVPKYQF